ncbi:MAG: lysoplasmalogenase [Pseudobacter sp.]|uniref:lysoplasmalogenase n=1 Tax=Pseudobacter sp. TaxID=2045420 RepID=UPI003F80BDE8
MRSANKRWLYLFLLDVMADLVAVYLNCTTLRYFTKPLLMILLLVWFLSYYLQDSRGRMLVTWALIFSCGGDIFLLFTANNEIFFMAGLVSFLVAHIFYLLFFLRVKKQNRPGKPWNPIVVFLMLIYISVLFYILKPGAGPLKVPVLVYASVLGAMLLAAIHAFHFPAQLSGAFCVTGAMLFVVSDSLLALDKFHQSFKAASLLVMTTYCLAQLLLVTGSRKYLQSRNNS